MQRSHLPPSKLDGPVGSRAARRQRPKRYSVFRLPMVRACSLSLLTAAVGTPLLLAKRCRGCRALRSDRDATASGLATPLTLPGCLPCSASPLAAHPQFRPDCKPYLLWSVLVLFSDLTYSAFIVPISIGMWTSFCELSSVVQCL